MPFWRGQFQRHINHGGTPFWCKFDFTVSRDDAVAGILVELTTADKITRRWFSYLRHGIERGIAKATERGTMHAGLRVEIERIYAHPLDTTEDGCERYGFLFVLDLLERASNLPCRLS